MPANGRASTRRSARQFELWTVVLAAGEGKRLRSLTRALHGEDLPKQFAVIQKDQSLLQATMDRVKRWSPPARTVVVVGSHQEDLARPQLAAFPGAQVVLQPRNVGTGPGLLLPLQHVLKQDPDARVVVIPSDHYVRDVEAFAGTVSIARERSRVDDSLVLVGAVPERPEPQYGWITREPDSDVVSEFVEKPDQVVAERLFCEGALWNTFIMAGSAARFWHLSRTHLPLQTGLFESLASARATDGRTVNSSEHRRSLSDIYEKMPPADFSRDVLERASSLRIVELAPCGWSDWGTPARVLQSLRGSPDHSVLVERLKACGPESGWGAGEADISGNHFAA